MMATGDEKCHQHQWRWPGMHRLTHGLKRSRLMFRTAITQNIGIKSPCFFHISFILHRHSRIGNHSIYWYNKHMRMHDSVSDNMLYLNRYWRYHGMKVSILFLIFEGTKWRMILIYHFNQYIFWLVFVSQYLVQFFRQNICNWWEKS